MRMTTTPTIGPVTWAVTPSALAAWWERWVERVGDHGKHLLSGAGPILLDAGPSEAGWHRLETWLRCQRLYGLIYERPRLKYDPGEVRKAVERNEVPPLILGSLIHIMVAHFSARWATQDKGFLYRWQDGEEDWSNGQKVLRVPSYAERLVRDPAEVLTPEVAVQVAAGRMLVVEGYTPALVAAMLTQALRSFEAWKQDQVKVMAGLEVVGVERPTVHIVRLADGTLRRISSRIDRITRERRTGIVFFEDHKSSAMPDLQKTMDLYTISGQMALLRHFGPLEFGEKFGGVLLNIIGTDAACGQKHRIPAGPAPRLAEDIVELIPYVEQQIQQNRDANFFPPRMSPAACKYGGRRCDGWELCTMGAGVKERR